MATQRQTLGDWLKWAERAYVRSGARYWRKFFPDLMARPIRWTG